MYLIVLSIFILKLELCLSQFPRHMDFQKVGDTIFNNEVYNILRPATHVVSDYFADYLLRRDNLNFPTKRLFIDDNGFRHYWSGFDKNTKSLRKTEILSDAIETLDNTTEKVNNTIIDKTRSGTNQGESNEAVENATDKNDTSISIDGKKDTTGVAKPDISKEATTTASNEDIEVVTFKNKNKSKDADIHLRGGATTKAPEKERDVITTTFFCPFFGVITMSAFVD